MTLKRMDNVLIVVDDLEAVYFAAQPVWRYAASLAGSAAICRSAFE